jgi:hypothetical protein
MSSPNALPDSESRPLPSSHEGGLSRSQRVLLDYLRAAKEMAYKLLCQSMQTLPSDERLTQAELDNALFELVRIGHLTSFFEDGDVIYMVQTSGARPPSKRDEQVLWNPMEMGLEGISLRRSSSPHAQGINRFNIAALTVQDQPPISRRTPTPGIAGIQRFNIPRDSMMNAPQVGETQEATSLSRRKAAHWSRRRGSGLNRARMGHRRSQRASGNSLSQRGRTHL